MSRLPCYFGRCNADCYGSGQVVDGKERHGISTAADPDLVEYQRSRIQIAEPAIR
jgi:hypothetical protein